MDDFKKIIFESNNIIKEKRYDFKFNGNLTECKMQLSDKKKIQNGFGLFDSVLDVTQGGYAISYGGDYLFTYGIEPCCGVVVYDNEKCILFHLDGFSLPQKVKQITDLFGFNNDSKVLICPGIMCGISGSFNYDVLEKIYIDAGYDTVINRINGTLGYISVSESSIKIGSAIQENEVFIERQAGLKKF